MNDILQEKLYDFIKVGILQIDLNTINSELNKKIQKCLCRTFELIPIKYNNF